MYTFSEKWELSKDTNPKSSHPLSRDTQYICRFQYLCLLQLGSDSIQWQSWNKMKNSCSHTCRVVAFFKHLCKHKWANKVHINVKNSVTYNLPELFTEALYKSSSPKYFLIFLRTVVAESFNVYSGRKKLPTSEPHANILSKSWHKKALNNAS